MEVAPLQRKTATHQCADQLRAAIFNRRWAPGELLPSERKLAEQFGVHRVTLRTAVKLLEAERLLSARHGSGYTVQDYLRSRSLDVLGPLVEAGAVDVESVVEDVLEIRRLLAGMLFERVLERLEEVNQPGASIGPGRRELLEPAFAAHQRMMDLLQEIDVQDVFDCDDELRETFMEADLAILGALVDLTDSAVLRLCLNPVSDVLRALPDLQRAMFRDPWLNEDAWIRLLSAFARDDRDGARQLLALLPAVDGATVQALREIRRGRPPSEVADLGAPSP